MLFPALLTAGAARFVWRGVGSDGPLKEINRYHTGRSDVAGPAGYARIRNQTCIRYNRRTMRKEGAIAINVHLFSPGLLVGYG